MSEIIDENFNPSIRGLEEGFPTIPLRKFTGTYNGNTNEKIISKEGTDTGKIRVKLSFIDLDMDTLESDEPYLFPVVELPISYSKKKTSTWGVFSESLEKLINPESDLKDQVGIVMTIEREDGHLFFTAKDGTKAEGTVWRVTALGGVGAPIVGATAAKSTTAPSINDIAFALLIGSTANEFGQKALQNPSIKTDSDMILKIVSGAFAKAMLEAGKVTVNAAGKYIAV